MSWYRTPGSLGRPAMSDLLPTDLPAVFFCVPSALASKPSAVSRRGSPGLTRRPVGGRHGIGMAWSTAAPGACFPPHPPCSLALITYLRQMRRALLHGSMSLPSFHRHGRRCPDTDPALSCPNSWARAESISNPPFLPVRIASCSAAYTSTSPLPLLLGFLVSWTCWLPNLSSVFLHC
jgi:hypothetical protein